MLRYVKFKFVQILQSTLHKLTLKSDPPLAVDTQVAWW